MATINIICVSIKETVEKPDKDKKKEDFGFDLKAEPKKFWIVKFEVALSVKTIKPMMGYETEAEARRFSEGKVYTPVEWLQLAFG